MRCLAYEQSLVYAREHADYSQKQQFKTTQKTAQKIISEIRRNSTVTRLQLAERCGISPDGIKWQLRKLQQQGVIRRVGSDRGGHWEIVGEK